MINRDAKLERLEDIERPRPGHADLPGAVKHLGGVRAVLERASARETAARVAAGGLARQLLAVFGIEVAGWVTELGGVVLGDRAGSLPELAALAGIDAAGLERTVNDFNELVRAGSAPALSPTRTTQNYPAHTIDKAPFYAIPLCAGITVTSGGIAVDGKARVLSQSGEPIAGLYAAASTVGGLEGGPRAGYVGGLIKAFGIGRIAGRSIADALAD